MVLLLAKTSTGDRAALAVAIPQIMSVNPGFGGQAYIPESTHKIRRLRAMLDENGADGAQLEVDGGINQATAASVVKAGASVLVAGSAVFNDSESVQQAMDRLRRIVDSAKT